MVLGSRQRQQQHTPTATANHTRHYLPFQISNFKQEEEEEEEEVAATTERRKLENSKTLFITYDPMLKQSYHIYRAVIIIR